MNDLIKSPLGRPLDPAYPSNIFAIVGSATFAVLFFLAELIGVADPASPFWVAGGAAFVAWAVSRELDPDNPSAAALALVISGSLAFFAQPSLLLAAGVLIAARVLAQTVGLALRSLEAAALIGWAAFLAAAGIGVAATPIMVATIWVRIGAWQAGAAAGLSAVAFSVFGSPPEWVSPGFLAVLLATAAVLATLMTVPASPPVSLTDIGKRAIPARGVSFARLAPLVAVIASLLLAGGAGVEAAMIGVASITATALIRLSSSRVNRASPTEAIGVGTE